MKLRQGIILVVALLLVGAGCTGNEMASNSNKALRVAGPGGTVMLAGDRLNLSGKELEEIPADVFDRSELLELDISRNKLAGVLSSDIQRLKKLRVLELGSNQLTDVPAAIGQLSDLQVLGLSNNKFERLPLEIGNLQNLRILDIRGNKISQQDLEAISLRLPQMEILQ